MEQKLKAIGAAFVPWGHDGYIIVPGGYGKNVGSSSSTTRNTIRIYNISADTWFNSNVRLSSRTVIHTAAVIPNFDP